MPTWRRGIAAWVLGGIILLGLGSGHPVLARVQTSSRAHHGWRTISLEGLSLRVPPTWHQGRQITLSVSAPLSNAVEVLTRFGVGMAQNHLPPHPQSYLSEQETTQEGQTTFLLGETSVSGAVYDLTITVPARQRALVGQVVRTLKLPPPTTATALVRQFNARHPAPRGTPTPAVSYIRTTFGSSRWLLVFGDPATIMESYTLFHSADAGRHWEFACQTGLQGSSAFPDTLGQPAMLFWTPTDGLLIESSMFYPTQLLVHRTTRRVFIKSQPQDSGPFRAAPHQTSVTPRNVKTRHGSR